MTDNEPEERHIFIDSDKSLAAIRSALETILEESGEPNRAALMMLGPLLLIGSGILAPAGSDNESVPLTPEDAEILIEASINGYAPEIVRNLIHDPNLTEERINAFNNFTAVISVIMARAINDEIDMSGHPLLGNLYADFMANLASTTNSN